MYINCGGPAIEIDDKEYEADEHLRGISNFVQSPDGKWAYSSTGVFLGNEKADYVARNVFSLNINDSSVFYQTARIAPISLYYFGFCMMKGNYNVKLHFAEIMFSNDRTFSSLGRRIFDVSIQVSNESTTSSFLDFGKYLN